MLQFQIALKSLEPFTLVPMPEIIPETRGRTPLPLGVKKKMISTRISPEALAHLEEHIKWSKSEGVRLSKAKALEIAIFSLKTCES